jgi:plastocyanin
MKRLILLVLLLAGFASAAEITGEVKVAGRKGEVPTYVWAEPLDAATAAKPGHFVVKQLNKEITPRVSVIPAGSVVDFDNQDSILHNVFSKAKPGDFDLGLYKSSRPVVFRYVNTYRVFCNIHPQMTAVIRVVPTSYIAEVGADGRYKLDVPPGKYRVTAWSERAAKDASAEISAGSSAALALDESQYVELPHKNKFGQDYKDYQAR